MVWLYLRTQLVFWGLSRERQDRNFRDDADIDTFLGPESIPILKVKPIFRLLLYWNQYWYWNHENVLGLILILIPILYLIRILPRPCKKCSGLWIDTDTDTETQEIPGSRLILILAALVSVLSIRYRYSRLSLLSSMFLNEISQKLEHRSLYTY